MNREGRRLSKQIKSRNHFTRQYLQDPRLSLVTVTDVRVTSGLKNARVFYTTLKEGDALEGISEGLKKASGFVQRKLASRIQLRYTPHITFVYDASVEEGARMDRILKDIEADLGGEEE